MHSSLGTVPDRSWVQTSSVLVAMETSVGSGARDKLGTTSVAGDTCSLVGVVGKGIRCLDG